MCRSEHTGNGVDNLADAARARAGVLDHLRDPLELVDALGRTAVRTDAFGTPAATEDLVFFEPSDDSRVQGFSIYASLAISLLSEQRAPFTDVDVWELAGALAVPRSALLMSTAETIAQDHRHCPDWAVEARATGRGVWCAGVALARIFARHT